MEWKDPLDALPKRHLPNGERCSGTPTVLPDDEPFEHLNTLLFTLAYFDMDSYRVARSHVGPLS